METPAMPPKRRRRPWLIVALLLVLATGVAWWEWPRGDQRLIGTWEVFVNFCDHPDQNRLEPIQSVTFYSNGSVQIIELQGKPSATMFAAWRLAGDELQVGFHVPALVKSSAMSIARRLAKWTGRYPVVFHEGNKETFRGPNEFREDAWSGNEGFVYRRRSK